MHNAPRATRSDLTLRLGVLALLLAALALDVQSCAVTPPRVEPVAPAASAALAEARLAFRLRPAGWRETTRERVEAARAGAPDWVAPERMLDELAREELRAAEALEERLAALRERPDDPQLLYLVGRLEGPLGRARFERAQSLAPDFGWAHHGEGWMRFLAGDRGGALRSGLRALDRARDAWERGAFGLAVARYQLALDRSDEAAGLLLELAADPALAPGDRDELLAWVVRAELTDDEEGAAERGFWRGVELLRTRELAASEVEELSRLLIVAAELLGYPEALEEVEAALAARPGPGRELMRASLLLERGGRALALGIVERAGTLRSGAGPTVRAARLAAGEGGRVIEDWLAELPALALGADGLPRRLELRRLVEVARTEPDPGAPAALAQALLDAGWFREARGQAVALAGRELELALEVDARAAAGRSLLGGLRRLLELVDAGVDYAGPWGAAASGTSGEESPAPAPGARRIGDLDQLLAAMQPYFDRHRGPSVPPEDLEGSPLLEFGPLATVVHPGPRFSAADEEAGRGTAGEAVGGLAADLLALGRFGVFGESVGGGGPDGTVLRLLAVEEIAGEHLGVPFTGTVAWCEGTDVPSRPVRLGARIIGAALHEGYWIDVAGVREELDRWGTLEREFVSGGNLERGRAALAGRGPLLPADAPSMARAQVYAPLGEADRVRLTVLLERAASGAGSARISLDELLELTALHEEGHLTDRSRYLPLSKNVWGALGLLAQAGFSPSRIAGLLEYRAQLVSLCVAPDPRLVLAECLDGAEGGSGTTPHAEAYGGLVADLLDVIDRERATFSALDDEHYLIHQLHGLGPEDVRRAALQLAREKGLVRGE